MTNYRAVITVHYPATDGTQSITEHTLVATSREQFAADVREILESVG